MKPPQGQEGGGVLGQRMLPGVGLCPKHQKMQLEAVNVSSLEGGSAPWKWFSTCTKPAPISQGCGKGGLAAVVTPWPSSVIRQSIWIFQMGLPLLFSVGLQEA